MDVSDLTVRVWCNWDMIYRFFLIVISGLVALCCSYTSALMIERHFLCVIHSAKIVLFEAI